MEKIKNKQQSRETIKRLGLNYVPFITIRKGEYEKAWQFLIDSPMNYYSVREINNSGGGAFSDNMLVGLDVIALTSILDEFELFPSLLVLDRENLILQGELQLAQDMSILGSLSNIKGISNRKAMANPTYNLSVPSSQTIPRIPGLDKVIEYMLRYELIGPVVEFTLYDQPVGVNSEPIVIWELRNY
jgi:hypothetical protein